MNYNIDYEERKIPKGICNCEDDSGKYTLSKVARKRVIDEIHVLEKELTDVKFKMIHGDE